MEQFDSGLSGVYAVRLVNISGCMIKPARPYVHILSLSAYSPGKPVC
jgi:hypothetical protein